MTFAPSPSTAWPDEIIQLLDEHHLVVLSDSERTRHQLGNALARHLDGLPETQVISIDGIAATDLPAFCRQLEHRLNPSGRSNGAWSRDVQGLIDVLRSSHGQLKRRYFIWHEAHAMLDSDLEVFCRIVNALFGVAAEFEHINMDVLVVQRVVFLGDQKLGAYAEDDNGQFCRWLDDEEDSPFWEVASVLDRPPVLTYRMDG